MHNKKSKSLTLTLRPSGDEGVPLPKLVGKYRSKFKIKKSGLRFARNEVLIAFNKTLTLQNSKSVTPLLKSRLFDKQRDGIL